MRHKKISKKPGIGSNKVGPISHMTLQNFYLLREHIKMNY